MRDVLDLRERSWSSRRIDPGMDLSCEPTGAKDEPWLPAQRRKKVSAPQAFHHNARATVHHDLFVGLWYLQSSRTRRVESGDLVRHTFYRPPCSQQLEHAAVLSLENLRFRTLANDVHLTL
jgi:hypothetical protein